ncbi:MAG: Penicillin acylase [Labilithrix sp.]|nr:Penicillin acylase [Labilithrix sp.]
MKSSLFSSLAPSVAKLVLCASVSVSLLTACGDDDGSESPGPGGPEASTVDAGGGDGGDGGDAGFATNVHIPGLSGPVRAVYDEYGFLHLSGKTDEDAFASLGYFHAANRFFFMDFLRNAIRGTLGKMISAPGIVDRDVTSRTFFATPNGDPLPEKLVSQFDAPTKAAVDAYAKGVNAWLADMRAHKNGASLTSEYSVASKDIRDWEPADSMAVALYSLNDLSNNADSEVTLGRVAAAAQAVAGVKPALAKTLQDLFLDFRPTFDAYTIPAANTPIAAMGKAKKRNGKKDGPSSLGSGSENVLALANERLRMLPGAAGPKAAGDTGSNNWVISGSRSTTGRPLLANDPHLALTNPSIWFPVEIDGKTGGTGTYHAAGGSFPGLPTIQTGHNESIAWGVTVSYWDLSDVYLETLTGPGSVAFKGASVNIVTKQVDFVDQGKTVTRTLAWVPHHGPIVSLDAANGKAVTIRWRGHDGSTDAAAFLGLGRATSIAEAKAALANITTANQNFVIADKSGKIGYFPYAKVPVRTWAAAVPGNSSPFFPLPGDGSREWGEPVALADIPQVEDPVAGFIATANGDITGASRTGNPLSPPPGQKPIQTVSRAEGTRLQRILESITANGAANSIDTMRALQGDTRSLIAVTVVPRLVEAAAAEPAGGFTLDPATQAVVSALTAWQTGGLYTCPTGVDGLEPFAATKSADPVLARESIGCTAFHTALYALFDSAFGDELSDPAIASAQLPRATGIPNNAVPVLVRSLRNATYDPTNETFWFDSNANHLTTRTEILQRALTRAGVALAASLGTTTDDWRWGKIHALTLRSPLSQPGVRIFDSNAYATPGGLFTVNVANPSSVDLNDNSLANRLRFAQSNGPSLRTLIEVGTDTPHMKIQLPGGLDLHRNAPFYNNLVERWISNTPVDFAFGAGAVKNPAIDVTVNP